jgi:hypothetical protein
MGRLLVLGRLSDREGRADLRGLQGLPAQDRLWRRLDRVDRVDRVDRQVPQNIHRVQARPRSQQLLEFFSLHVPSIVASNKSGALHRQVNCLRRPRSAVGVSSLRPAALSQAPQDLANSAFASSSVWTKPLNGPGPFCTPLRPQNHLLPLGLPLAL